MSKARLSLHWCLALAVVWLAYARSGAGAQSSNAPATSVLRDLHGMPEFRSTFDGESDKVRILMLLSPT